MATRRTSLIAVSAALAALAGGGLYLAKAVTWSTAPELAQAPMNIVSQVAPAFIMGVDNSGSMSTDETLFRTSDGVGHFNSSTSSFFDAAGNPLESGTSVSKHMDGGYNADYYGALRSPEYNRAFFDPATIYTPWMTSTGVPEADVNPAAAAEDPRGAGYGAATPFTTFNFTTYLTTTETWPSGKVVPAGTWVYNNNTCNRAPGSSTTTNSWVQYATEKQLTQSCSIQFRYYPARVYLSLTATPPPGFDTSKRVLVKGAGPLNADMYRYDYIESNFTTDGAAAVQNFANWWTYYGNRNRSMIAAMTHSLSNVNNMRVGYFTINPAPPSGNVTMRDMDVQADKNALYTTMRNLNASGNTPTRRATAYMVKQFTRTDSGAPIKLQCQKNAGMLFTDGYTNDDNSGLTGILNVGNVDGSYPAPYGGGVVSSNTIADYAMYGYVTNLRSDLPAGKVPVPSECSGTPANGTDCNANLHMNFYGVTLGARGAIYDVNAAATADPYANPPSWAATGTMNLNPANVDDIWHAALNSRGEFINAQSPAAVTAAMRRILASVGEGATLAGTIGVKGSRIGSGSMSVEPGYVATNNGTDWYGELTAYTLSTTSTVVSGQTVTTVTETERWEANDRMPAPGDRDIQFGAVSGSSVVAQDFDTANITTLDQVCDGSDPLAVCSVSELASLASVANAVSYLRGDQTLSSLRTRTKVLGDIVNSSPVVSIPTDDYGYAWLDSSYTAYLANKKATNRPLVFVGANDGMFHVFDGRETSAGGKEVYAYIPATSVGHMGNLLYPYNAADEDDQKFQHRYFVDGPVTVGDVRIGGAWKTIAVGTSGAGGKSVFALDVTNPSSPSLLWEVNNLVGSHASSMGYVLGKPVIVPVKNAAGGTVSWKVIFGNGYNSAAQSATLFVVDAGSGAVQTITAAENPVATSYNGLGNISVLDRQYLGNSGPAVDGRDGYADTVYAADQAGAIWKFDLTGSGSVDRGGKPLFVAKDAGGNRQAILGGLTAAPGLGGGVFVYFGSGSFSFVGDQADADAETLYGILDTDTIAAPATTTVTRAGLTGQSTGSQFTSGGHTYLGTTSNAATGQYGWYLDLPSGQRFVGNPSIANGVVFFPVYEPSLSASDDCSTPGDNWLYGLNAFTGAAALSDVRLDSPTGTQPGSGTGAIKLDTNPATSAPIKDVAVLTTPRATPCVAGDPDCNPLPGCYMAVQAPGAPTMYLPRACGRQSWRQVR
ncbi:MAG: PilC/PilY family type IV pilus protein [Pseudoxanthomonas sp.]